MNKRTRWTRLLPTLGPGTVWLLVFTLVPTLLIFYTSFLQRDPHGWLSGPLTLENYRRFFGIGPDGIDPLYLNILGRSLLLGFVTTLATVLIGYPFAFFIAASPRKNLLLLLVVLPFWTNFLIRVYAWIVIFQRKGVLNALLGQFGMDPVLLYPSWTAVYVGTIYTYLPFLILPLYASVEKIDWTLLEAAHDLGAGKLRGFWHAVFPQTLPGLIAGILLVFIPAVGTFVISDLLGAGKAILVGNVIQQQFGASRDWAFGSAAAFVLMAVVLAGLWLYARWAGERGMEELV
ncbi:ABC transporter permease [Deinococcota bacterium DY0809b]